MIARLVGVFAALAPFGGCDVAPAATSPSADEIRAALAAVHRSWSDAFVREDVDALLGHYTEDAVLLPPGGEFRGQEGVRQWMSQDSTWDNLVHFASPTELRIYDSIAVELGTWNSTWRVGGGPEQSASDRYLIVWKLSADGRWRFQYDMWHVPSALPTPAP
jgi:ketosteroid isomerase-like protein